MQLPISVQYQPYSNTALFQRYCRVATEISHKHFLHATSRMSLPLGLDCRSWESEQKRHIAKYLRDYFRDNPTDRT